MCGLLASTGCGGGDNAVSEAPSGTPAALAEPATGSASADAADYERFQRLNFESLRLMIEAAQRELDIGPVQTRISAATMASMQSMTEAADQMEQVVADLKAMLGN